jgi:hypothetical protein
MPLGLLTAYVATGDALVVSALAVLWAIWMLLPSRGGPPVLALACTHQWLQVTVGMFFAAITATAPLGYLESDWRPMVMIGLASVLSIAVGLRLGAGDETGIGPRGTSSSLSVTALTLVYLAVSVLVIIIKELVLAVPALSGLYQGAVFLGFSRLVVFFIILRLLLRPTFRWVPFTLFVLFEAGVGLTGYLANFREVFVLAALALVEAFNRRRAGHWVAMVGLVIGVGGTGIVWQSIKGALRQYYATLRVKTTAADRVQIVGGFARAFAQDPARNAAAGVSAVVDRAWAVYYPALAVERVPRIIPHTNGMFLSNAVAHVLQPRFFFPDKNPLMEDSEKVRRFSGVFVAGAESATSIAFGYAAEGYIDFGVPLMFLPILAFGWLCGRAFRFFSRNIRSDVVAVGMTTVGFWLSLFLFEVSWDRMLGVSITIFLFLGGGALFADRFLIEVRGIGTRRMPLNVSPVAGD